ncbi:MAG: hypothetical protein KGL44_11040, partial [Sphingomonadales bacterium]|nr:hypothetical protein [Sphingomonadales bacterium]
MSIGHVAAVLVQDRHDAVARFLIDRAADRMRCAAQRYRSHRFSPGGGKLADRHGDAFGLLALVSFGSMKNATYLSKDCSMNVQDIVTAAQQQTGLTDFGDPAILEAL